MPVTDKSPTEPDTHLSRLRTLSIAATQRLPPNRVAQIDLACLRSGRISPVAASTMNGGEVPRRSGNGGEVVRGSG